MNALSVTCWVAVLAAPVVGSCTDDRKPPVFPAVSGGTLAVGGSSAVAGSSTFGGSSSVAGSSAVGGSTTALSVVCDDVASRRAAPGEIEELRRKLMPAPVRAMRARPKASYVVLPLPSQLWAPLAPTLDQIGSSCVGFGLTQWRVSEPWPWFGAVDVTSLTQLGLDIYSRATHLDSFDGAYPPDDTGSDGDAGMAAMKERGLVSSFQKVVTFEGLQRELQRGPCVTGTAWYSGMFSPNRCGRVELTGTIEGYHEWKLAGIDYDTKEMIGLNSWGNNWGARDSRGQRGYFRISFGNYTKLMAQGADAHCGKP